MKCPYCLEEISNTETVCPVCGEKIPKPKKNTAIIIISVVTVCVLLLAVISATVFYQINNQPVTARFIEDESTEGTFFNNDDGLCSSGTVHYLVDKNGKRINNVKYGACPEFGEYSNNGCNFSEGLASVVVKKDGKDKCGYINAKGEFVIEPQFDNASPFSKGAATVQKGSTYGILFKNGKFLPIDCDNMTNFSNGYALITKNGKSALINSKGKITIPYKYNVEFSYYYEKGDYVLECQGNWQEDDYGKYCAYVRKKDGKRITGYRYTAASNGGMGSREFSEGLAAAKTNGKIIVIDEKGKEVIRTSYLDDWSGGDYFSEGLLKVTKDHNLFGFIDKKGNIVIPLEYNDARPFKNGYAIVKKDNQLGYIDKKNVFKRIPTSEIPKNEDYYSLDYFRYYIKNGHLVKIDDDN